MSEMSCMSAAMSDSRPPLISFLAFARLLVPLCLRRLHLFRLLRGTHVSAIGIIKARGYPCQRH